MRRDIQKRLTEHAITEAFKPHELLERAVLNTFRAEHSDNDIDADKFAIVAAAYLIAYLERE